jgi:hypothetical protein
MSRLRWTPLAAFPFLLLGCHDATPDLLVPFGEGAMSRGGPPAPPPGASFEFASPVFGLGTAPDGSLLAAAILDGVREIRKGTADLVAPLAGVTDVAAIGRGNLLAITSEPVDPRFAENAQKLFRISQGNIREIADLYAFEIAVNPDQIWNPLPPESNPFGLALLAGGTALVADAAGNSILVVDEEGSVDWVAVLTPRPASTDYLKELAGCQPGDAFFPCILPPVMNAQPVPTSVAVGPDGAYHVGELTGFPRTPGLARVWRIEPGSRHVLCPSPACTLVADGLTSIMDLAFGRDGTLYVVEYDAAGWFAVDFVSGGFPLRPVDGGRVKACNVGTGSCTIVAQGLALPTAVTPGKDGTVWVAENATIPFGAATVRPIP